jgi:hypothetical protein
VAAVAITGGAVIAAVVPASPAVGFFSPPLLLEIHVNSPATLVAKGAGVNVTVQIECSGARTAEVDVRVTERSGSQVASGFGSVQVGCTNANQTVLVPVTASSGKVFKKGSAIAQGFIFACTPNFSVCGSEQDQQTIQIT